MSRRSPFKSLWLSLLLLLPARLHATGFDEPARWLVDYDEKRPAILVAPEFYFELEVRRIAAEQTYARRSPAPPVLYHGSDQCYEADQAEFADALATKRIAPPNAVAAIKANATMRDVIEEKDHTGKVTPDKVAVPVEFPSEFADYHRGALLFHQGEEEKALEVWRKLLERPATERHYRTTWALYMLGKQAIEEKKYDEARGWFIKVRAAIAEGFADSINLYAASLGWEAYALLEDEKYSDAARLYLEQLAGGDASAAGSLRVVLDDVFKEETDPKELAELAADPVLQRLGTAGAVSRMSSFQAFYNREGAPKSMPMRWLATLEKGNAKSVRDADRLAWVAYAAGDFKTSARWLARADQNQPYALWLRAKFALRDLKVNDAATLLARAVAGVPVSGPLVSRSIGGYETPPDRCMKNDLGLLRLSRGEFLQAFSVFVDSQQIKDAEYVADVVLTIDELKKIVDRDFHENPKKPPEQPAAPLPGATPTTEPAPATEEESVFEPSAWPTQNENPANAFRGILASRYVRAGRYAEARPYLTEEARPELDDYVVQLDASKKPGASKAERSAALWAAAQIMLNHGNALADYYDPVTAVRRLNAREVDIGDSSVISMKLGKPLNPIPSVAKAEQDRLRAHSKPELRRYYSTYLAADLAWQAAALLPDNEEATAKMLNTAGSWLKIGDEKAADRFYQAIERRCAKTEIGKEAIKRHWFVPESENN